ncbi:YggS family pyridoxal phosphate-dependent enzyme [Parasphingorhabdus flavimaris]|jgi:PLP dependent protein|uniref:Pyridoxal phosphate homeostasis protein n=1 Tax=Parasphingorhabdus flavimaris TaxID=266812 RepID=A0ABX2N587_9SPHN|nr:YggS family pyridoxal phosphate-dependent enzyme [Parasphingorhabdus flavimaris]|tara:strand:+ start:8928 stop:9617 length:690 start_codon:yes stop_codon:yes gene_type:complete
MTVTGKKLENPPLDEIGRKIEKSAKIAGRKADEVALVAVSKTRSSDEIRPLLESGHRVFGENRVQEAAEKWPALKAEYPDVELHMIGQLQSNKAAEAVALFDYIHSVDRMSLVKALGKEMDRQDRHPPCFLQVNIGEESQKGGCDIAAVPQMLQQLRDAGIKVAGLMAVPPEGTNAMPYFALLAKLARDNGLDGLSMGMSGDFEKAIKLGATHIRVGTALFGPRETNQT